MFDKKVLKVSAPVETGPKLDLKIKIKMPALYYLTVEQFAKNVKFNWDVLLLEK